ncbi:hypothetical protein J1C47_22565, partial [Jiella sp. MQZ13P-4]|nr:hypothetical protein [Jiella sonneratiae]
RFVILVLDGAGYHTKPNLAVPDGMRLVHQPAYTPEVQPAEHLWPLVDEPLANRYFETLGDLELVSKNAAANSTNNAKPSRRIQALHGGPSQSGRPDHPNLV